MSLVERLSSAKPRETGLPCGISKILEEMSSEEQEALNTVLFAEPRTISNAQLQEILLDEGYDIANASIKLHRRKQCRCFVGRSARMSASQ
jgi:hypothetical protein